MTSAPLVSVCIPAYKNPVMLKRLLDSVACQSFQDIEVIVTDDSPDDSVGKVVALFKQVLPVTYHKNEVPLGTPENWNAAIRLAKGRWIKLVHHDDWLVNDKVLDTFVKEAQKHPDCPFFFAAFQNVDEERQQKKEVRCTFLDLVFLKMNPLHLFKKVYVGNPSCTFIRNDIGLEYDRRFKFVVDFEYYIRCFRQEKKYRYINEVLLNVGFHSEQVTQYTFLVPDVQIPENIIMLRQFGEGILYNFFVYDYYWRMFRNLGIRDLASVKKYYQNEVPVLLQDMISAQARIAPATLKKGIWSKLFMARCFISSLFKKHRQ